jgi:UDP-N-acetylglucosamine 2-epimerase (non-hydrolysing)
VTRAPAARARRRPLIVHVVGARPNYMKIAPVYAALDREGRVDQRLVHTGQHYDPLLRDVFFEQLSLPEPDVKLEIGSGSHAAQTGSALIALEPVFTGFEPQLVVVAGDVNSTLAGALAAAKLDIPVCHVEAGLRSFDPSMPEEHNRRLTDHLSTLLLAHSDTALDNLAAEGIAGDAVQLVGNTMIDSLLQAVDAARGRAAYRDYGVEQGAFVLVTLHRPKLVDDPVLLARTLETLGELAATLPVIFPAHPRTAARIHEFGLTAPASVQIVEPLPYLEFVSLELAAAAVATDSGGVQEESTVLGIPCFTLRDNTERPVTITHGTNELLGLEPERLLEIPQRLNERGSAPAEAPPFWDGHAGERAAREIEHLLDAMAVSPAR